MMKLYIVRHGETDWNKARRIQGHSDIPLNEYGLYLAGQTAEGLRDVAFDIVYTSPLMRARQTADAIIRDREVRVIEEERIAEMNFGAYEGMCISGRDRAAQGEAFDKFFLDTAHFVPAEGGESVRGLLERTGEFLREICSKPGLQEKTVLVSTHGAALTALLNNIKGNLDIGAFWEKGVPANCAVTVVAVSGGVPRIEKENLVFYREPVRAWKAGE